MKLSYHILNSFKKANEVYISVPMSNSDQFYNNESEKSQLISFILNYFSKNTLSTSE